MPEISHVLQTQKSCSFFSFISERLQIRFTGIASVFLLLSDWQPWGNWTDCNQQGECNFGYQWRSRFCEEGKTFNECIEANPENELHTEVRLCDGCSGKLSSWAVFFTQFVRLLHSSKGQPFFCSQLLEWTFPQSLKKINTVGSNFT